MRLAVHLISLTSCHLAVAQMDEKGWIPLAIIANFNRVRMLTPNMMLIVESLRDSQLVEVAPDCAYVRAKGSWEQWILPPQQRDLSHNPVSPKAPGEDVGASKPPAAAVSSASPMAAAAGGPASTSLSFAPSTSSTMTWAKRAAQAPPPPANGRAGKKPTHADDEDDDDVFEMDEDQADGGGRGGDAGNGGGLLGEYDFDTELEKLIVVTQTGRGKRGGKPSGMDDKMAKELADGLAAYEQELLDLKGGQKQRPPRAPSGGAGKVGFVPHMLSCVASTSLHAWREKEHTLRISLIFLAFADQCKVGHQPHGHQEPEGRRPRRRVSALQCLWLADGRVARHGQPARVIAGRRLLQVPESHAWLVARPAGQVAQPRWVGRQQEGVPAPCGFA